MDACVRYERTDVHISLELEMHHTVYCKSYVGWVQLLTLADDERDVRFEPCQYFYALFTTQLGNLWTRLYKHTY